MDKKELLDGNNYTKDLKYRLKLKENFKTDLRKKKREKNNKIVLFNQN